MAFEQDDAQPAQDQCREVDPSTSEEELPEQQERPPMEKSGVYNDPKAMLEESGRFETKSTVHMSLIEHGIRMKGTFKVYRGRRSASGYWEYQLLDNKGNLYLNGAWIREKHLKAESGRR